jgi:hypothetical protein
LFEDFEIASRKIFGWLDYRSMPADVAAEDRYARLKMGKKPRLNAR